MTTNDLGGPILASVSRSFYLSIRILPAAVRDPISLAYLLARASDTIADTSSCPVEERLESLSAFAAMVESTEARNLSRLQAVIRPEHRGEQALIAQLDRCLTWLKAMPSADRAEITTVLAKIIYGQQLDLERFARPAQITALQTAAELDQYTYLVAGCVGEFWTRICLAHLPNFSDLDSERLIALGCGFGKGLQLVNILRDLPADLRAGRCYLPEEQLEKSGLKAELLLDDPVLVRPIFDHWLEEATKLLGQGQQYIAAVNPPRLRIGCFLPWVLGLKTLNLLRKRPPLESPGKIKVSRSTVYRALFCSLPVALSNLCLEHIGRRNGSGESVH